MVLWDNVISRINIVISSPMCATEYGLGLDIPVVRAWVGDDSLLEFNTYHSFTVNVTSLEVQLLFLIPQWHLITLYLQKDRKAQRRLAKKAERRRNKQKVRSVSPKYTNSSTSSPLLTISTFSSQGSDVGVDKSKSETQRMSKDMPRLRNMDVDHFVPLRTRGGHSHHKRKLCETDNDCVRGIGLLMYPLMMIIRNNYPFVIINLTKHW